MNTNKKRLIAVAVFLAFAAVFAGIFLATRPAPSAGDKSITVEIVHSDGQAKTFTEKTDFEYLGQWLLEEKLVTQEEYDSGFYTLIDGESAVWTDEEHVYWALYEGEDYAMQGINETPLVDGGSYSLIYTRE